MIKGMIKAFRDFSPSMQRFIKVVFTVTALLFTLLLTACHQPVTGVLNPKGIVAYQERKLLFDSLALMLIVVIPVIIMSFTFVYHYQQSHKTRDYKPNWSQNHFLEAIWWGIPIIIIFVLGVLTWKKTHELDPYRAISSTEKPVLIQVIGLPWKWLFIYPEQHIATLNYLEIPVGRQVEFWMTVDNVPMSAFFIPQLGSQIYAMAGMRTRLYLAATQEGVFKGLNTQFNGGGFSDMYFETHVVESNQFDQWVKQMKLKRNTLTQKEYEALLTPSEKVQPEFYSAVLPGLFEKAIQTYQAIGLDPWKNRNKTFPSHAK